MTCSFSTSCSAKSSMAEYALIAICVILVLLPPKWDPAIRIKEWQIKQGWHPESKDRDE